MLARSAIWRLIRSKSAFDQPMLENLDLAVTGHPKIVGTWVKPKAFDTE